MVWETVIGLEIHCQLATKSKLFSAAATAFGAVPNTQACAVDLGLPGVLPTINKEAIRMAIQFGLAVKATISDLSGDSLTRTSVFARKNYFYPDLPKGYQISQFDHPIVRQGQLDIELEDGATKTITITRAHLEEDAGKSIHEGFEDSTGIDLNRAGTPLLEIVSEPELSSAKEAVAYMKKLHSIVCYLDICDGNLQEGSFRCDANVSVRKPGQQQLGTRTELKNINSFRFVEQAINFEIQRHIDILEAGGAIVQETRLYNPSKNETRSMRSKEEANDYRYFPDPDLLPVEIKPALIEAVQQSLPELPDDKKKRFIEDYQVSLKDATMLTTQRELADYFENCVKTSGNVTQSVNWVTGELTAALNKENKRVSDSPVSAVMLGNMIKRIDDKTLSSKTAKQVFTAMWDGEGNVDDIIDKRNLKQVTDSAVIEEFVNEVIANNSAQVTQYQAANPEKQAKLIGYFVGQVMRQSKGKANPQQVNKLIQEKLNQK